MTTVVKQVRQVAGVSTVKIKNFRKGHLVVKPKAGTRISPRDLWDAVKKAGFTPRKLKTPSHEYDKRPPA